jgi:RecA-family ATPase
MRKTRTPQPEPALPIVQAAALEEHDTDDAWLVEQLWSRSGVGIVGGAPKCCKSWLGLELAVAVASATPCLGRFNVQAPGPVLVYLAEDSPHFVAFRCT